MPAPADPVSIRSIGTAVPDTVIGQEHIRDVFRTQPGLSRLATRLVGSVFDAAAIDTRHTVIDELGAGGSEGGGLGSEPLEAPVFLDSETGRILDPSTGTRNDVYVERSPALFEAAARDALDRAEGITAADVTHVVTVSCTGFFAPGPDYLLVRALGLAASTRRLHIGFMGCYGAFPAIRSARDTCLADPDAVVLVVCAELCTLHLRSSSDPDAIVASSVFADGAAAAIITARPAPEGSRVLDVEALETVLTPVGEGDMAWSIGDSGFDMVLSSYVPHIVEQHVDEALAALWTDGLRAADIDLWAVHPGGRSIVDRVQNRLGLADHQVAASRKVLREAGNMSSATVLFVMREALTGEGGAWSSTAPPRPQRVVAMAFGPGLTVETGSFRSRIAS
ncbi:naringenin-chalcone synthase [Frigoribacterium sp. Leaf263]|uniref:type III polyketide synthase n=1 Tax=Frigoribacterium sp. Leaf263 TaxID=1736313 RepID=UPI0006F763B8|nr:3-oxoacyl-[acyl-carrier-protein] synthase III C-terminal domain-containing protein [Frigoribacterium sp. Leaf263]KQO82353.1 naringenin-chalcone synthase [Frigoribacterium sp. Leaf263]